MAYCISWPCLFLVKFFLSFMIQFTIFPLNTFEYSSLLVLCYFPTSEYWSASGFSSSLILFLSYPLDDLIQAYSFKHINILKTPNFISMPWTSKDLYKTPLRYLIGTYNFTGPLSNSQFFLLITFPFDFSTLIPDSWMDLNKSLLISVLLFSIYKSSLKNISLAYS